MRKRTNKSAPKIHDRYIIPALILAVVDGMVLVGAFLLAYMVRFYTPLFDFINPGGGPVPDFEPYLVLALMISALGLFVFERIGLYQRRVGLDRKVWVVTLILATLVNYVFVMALLFNYRGFEFSRLTVGLAIPFSSLGVVATHYLLKQAQLYLLDRGIIFFKTVLVGPASQCRKFQDKMLQYYGSQYQVLGFVSTENKPATFAETASPKDAIPCIGVRNDLDALLEQGGVDQVIITMPPEDHREILEIMNTCRQYNTPYRMTPELYDLLAQRVQVEEIEEMPALLFDESPLIGAGRMLKRSCDILISSMALIIASPLMLFIAALIRFDTRGPVFYVQERVGNDGRRFHIYKFRSMVDKAEQESGPIWATSNDPRTTIIGRFLRKYNLDELPQFFNVLRGDMSLVGPRPERPYFVNKFKGEIPNYMRRHMVKTGITGWAQVNGWRGDTSVGKRTEHDLYYVKNWSLFLDIKIILKTLVSFKNAY